MRRVRLLTVGAIVLFALGAVAATSIASAEEDPNSPSLLVLEGKATEAKATLKGGASSISTLGGKEFKGSSVEAKLENCEKLEGSEKDGTLCKNQVISFTGVKQGAVSCRSENAKGEKDAVETILALLDLHIAAESVGTELGPLALAKVLGPVSGEEELTINCGGVKDKVKGVLPCLLLPGLVMTKKGEILCKQSATTHDQETGKCERLCELLEKNPFLSNLGAGFEDAGMSIHAGGEVNKEGFIDD